LESATGIVSYVPSMTAQSAARLRPPVQLRTASRGDRECKVYGRSVCVCVCVCVDCSAACCWACSRSAAGDVNAFRVSLQSSVGPSTGSFSTSLSHLYFTSSQLCHVPSKNISQAHYKHRSLRAAVNHLTVCVTGQLADTGCVDMK